MRQAQQAEKLTLKIKMHKMTKKHQQEGDRPTTLNRASNINHQQHLTSNH
jgi:hypothetical protein